MSEKERDNNRTKGKRNMEVMEEYTKPAIGLTAPLKKMCMLPIEKMCSFYWILIEIKTTRGSFPVPQICVLCVCDMGHS